jgi:hypothetical protein
MYIDTTLRHIEARINEHHSISSRSHIRLSSPLSIRDYCIVHDHQCLYTVFKVIASRSNRLEVSILESLLIKQINPHLIHPLLPTLLPFSSLLT